MEFYRNHILVCTGEPCVLKGALEVESILLTELQKQGLENEIRVIRTGCLGPCNVAPVLVVYPEGIYYSGVKPGDVQEIVAEHLVKGRPVTRLVGTDVEKRVDVVYQVPQILTGQERVVLRNCGIINPDEIVEYIGRGGYEALGKALIHLKPEEVIEEVKSSGLRGRGGAAFPTGLKWSFTASGEEKYLICNADEGEPGTFKDRLILEGDPHAVLEGMAIAGYAVGAEHGFIYIRGEYTLSIERVQRAIDQARKLGLLGKNIFDSGFSFDVEIRVGAGAYICGEELALIESIEGKRGEPRYKPPYPGQTGLWGKPTVVNNVETLANVPHIIEQGAEWYKSIGTPGSPGTKVFTLTGNIKNEGLIEVPMGITLREIIYQLGGGIPDGHSFKMAQTGGTAGGCLPPEMLDVPMDYDELAKVGSALGSGALLIMDDRHCIVDLLKCFMRFFNHESCGKCTPCREGTPRLLELIEKIMDGTAVKADLDLMAKLAENMEISSLCGLGQSSPKPVLTLLEYYQHEFLAHIEDKKCPAGVCKKLQVKGVV